MNEKLAKLNGLKPQDFEPERSEDALKELREQNEMLIECILELSELLYN